MSSSNSSKLDSVKILLVLVLSAFSVFVLSPTILGSSGFFSKKLNLGLDLQGGVQVVLKMRFDSSDRLQVAKSRICRELKKANLPYSKVQVLNEKLEFQVKGAKERFSELSKVVKGIEPDLELGLVGETCTLKYSPASLSKFRSDALEQSIEIVRRRVDSMGTKEPTIQAQGQDSILLQVPGFTDARTLRSLLGKTAKLAFHLVTRGDEYPDLDDPSDSPHESDGSIHILAVPFLTGDLVVDAGVQFVEGAPVVGFELNSFGARIFSDITRKHKGKQIAITLDGEPISMPRINDHISGGRVFIYGDFSFDQAQELSLLLKSGALPTPLDIIEETFVGPTLGNDSIKYSKKAAIVAFALVVGLIILRYALLGIIASLGLVVVLLFICATLILFQVTLTLPGIAGIILTLGMAVDANILVYEHIRECLHSGSSSASAIREGFALSFKTILDANLTSFIAAVLLYTFGIGAIRGFALTFGLGIVASMIGCFWVTQPLVSKYGKFPSFRSCF